MAPAHHQQHGPCAQVHNHTELPILVILSQLTPLHWAKVEPRSSHVFDTGKVSDGEWMG